MKRGSTNSKQSKNPFLKTPNQNVLSSNVSSFIDEQSVVDDADSLYSPNDQMVVPCQPKYNTLLMTSSPPKTSLQINGSSTATVKRRKQLLVIKRKRGCEDEQPANNSNCHTSTNLANNINKEATPQLKRQRISLKESGESIAQVSKLTNSSTVAKSDRTIAGALVHSTISKTTTNTRLTFRSANDLQQPNIEHSQITNQINLGIPSAQHPLVPPTSFGRKQKKKLIAIPHAHQIGRPKVSDDIRNVTESIKHPQRKNQFQVSKEVVVKHERLHEQGNHPEIVISENEKAIVQPINREKPKIFPVKLEAENASATMDSKSVVMNFPPSNDIPTTSTDQHQDTIQQFMASFPFNHLQKRYRRFRVDSIVHPSSSADKKQTSKILYLVEPDQYDVIHQNISSPLTALDSTTTTISTSSGCPSGELDSNQLRAKQQFEPKRYIVKLKREWRDTIVNEGDYVNIIGRFNSKGVCVLDPVKNANYRIIVNPDYLLSATTISEASKCLRIAFFRELYSEYGVNKAAMLGTLSHEVLQSALNEYLVNKNPQAFSTAHLIRFSKEALSDNILNIHALGMNESQVLEELRNYHASFKQFKDKFITIGESISWDRENYQVKLNDCHDIEETIWSPMNGLKGNIDVTARFTIAVKPKRSFLNNHHYQKNTHHISNNNNNEVTLAGTHHQHLQQDVYMPMELKSGKIKRLDHEAQIILYLAMLSDKYDMEFDKGILFYFKNAKYSTQKGNFKQQRVHTFNNNNNDTELTKPYGTIIGTSKKDLLLRHLLRNRNLVASSLMNTVVFDYNKQQAEIYNEKKKNNRMLSIESVSNSSQLSRHSVPIKIQQVRSTTNSINSSIESDHFSQGHPVPLSDIEDLADMNNEDLYFDLIPKAPPMRKDVFTCQTCFQKQSCFLYHAAVENGNCQTSGVPQLFDSIVASDLTMVHRQYLDTWLKLIDLESLEMNHFRKEIWTMTGPEREACGRCASCMVIQEDSESSKLTTHATQNDDSYQYTFVKYEHAPKSNLEQLHMSIGDYVTISSEEGHLGLSSGTIVHMNSTSITVRTKKAVKIPRIPHPRSEAKKVPLLDLYRIDMDEYGGRMNQQRGFLMSLFSSTAGISGSAPSTRPVLRFPRTVQLLVDLQVPRFTPLPSTNDKLNRIFQSNWWQTELNSDQRQAIHNVLISEDYSLILGMPGTGKTTTIVYLLRVLIELDKTILLTSYTHTAVDNILIKCIEMGLGHYIVRLGKSASVHDAIHPYLLSHLIPDYSGLSSNDSSGMVDGIGQSTTMDQVVFEQLKVSLSSRKIVACTCLGIGELHLLGPDFNNQSSSEPSTRLFDYCIIDEAGQITQCVSIGPILKADKFVLVGDHHQLEPLVANHKAKQMGMNVSLFQLLYDTHCRSIEEKQDVKMDGILCYLRHQYRMNRDVLALCNELVYKNKLICGNEKVANARFEYPNRGLDVPVSYDKPNWMYNHVLDPAKSVIFVNTDPYGTEHFVGFKLVNKFEQIFICEMVTTMVKELGADPSEIGIITPYRLQTYHLRNMLNDKLGTVLSRKVEIFTIDKFQGKDKSCIIMSLVRSNSERIVDELVINKKRMNVGMTRAKMKMIIVGSYNTHKKQRHVGDFIGIMKRNGWISNIDENIAQRIQSLCTSNKTSTATNDLLAVCKTESKVEITTTTASNLNQHISECKPSTIETPSMPHEVETSRTHVNEQQLDQLPSDLECRFITQTELKLDDLQKDFLMDNKKHKKVVVFEDNHQPITLDSEHTSTTTNANKFLDSITSQSETHTSNISRAKLLNKINATSQRSTKLPFVTPSTQIAGGFVSAVRKPQTNNPFSKIPQSWSRRGTDNDHKINKDEEDDLFDIFC